MMDNSTAAAAGPLTYCDTMTPATYRAIRKSLGLTQAELGATLGLTCRAVQAHEGGEREIPPPVARLLLAIQRDATLLDCLRAA